MNKFYADLQYQQFLNDLLWLANEYRFPFCFRIIVDRNIEYRHYKFLYRGPYDLVPGPPVSWKVRSN